MKFFKHLIQNFFFSRSYLLALAFFYPHENTFQSIVSEKHFSKKLSQNLKAVPWQIRVLFFLSVFFLELFSIPIYAPWRWFFKPTLQKRNQSILKWEQGPFYLQKKLLQLFKSLVLVSLFEHGALLKKFGYDSFLKARKVDP